MYETILSCRFFGYMRCRSYIHA